MDFLGLVIIIIFAFFIGRIYEYRIDLKECKKCKEGFENE